MNNALTNVNFGGFSAFSSTQPLARWNATAAAAAVVSARAPTLWNTTTHSHRRDLLGSRKKRGLVMPPIALTKVPISLSYDAASLGERPLTVDGRDAWVLRPVDGRPNTYAIISAMDSLFLSAHARGRHLQLAQRDDGSGRQHWKIFKLSSDQGWYTIALAGGKADAIKLLVGGMLAGDDGRLAIADDSPGLARWTLVSAPAAPPAPQPPPRQTTGAVPGVDEFPAGTLQGLQTLTGLDPEQIFNVLAMIQGPEQARWEWCRDNSGASIYGYAEAIGDGRGVTVGLYGATTGQGYDDAKTLWKLYGHPELATLGEEDLIQKVKSIANEPAWRKAMWDAYIATYWKPSADLLRSYGFKKALTLGAVLDASMNAGMEDDDSKHWGSAHLVQAAHDISGNNEAAFMEAFLALRSQYPTDRSGNMRRRIEAWRNLLRNGQWDMRGIDIRQFVYIPN